MDKENYGITKDEYRKLIEDSEIKASDILRHIKLPLKVYRYRRLGYEKNGRWEKTHHWEDDIDGICMFSVPNQFNKNHNEDCKVRFDEKAIIKHMFREYNRENRRKCEKNQKRKLRNKENICKER